jgi:hypothetical protein
MAALLDVTGDVEAMALVPIKRQSPSDIFARD